MGAESSSPYSVDWGDQTGKRVTKSTCWNGLEKITTWFECDE